MKISFTDPHFRKLLGRFPLVAIDVGARGGLKKNWIPLQRYLKCIAFEPNPEEYERLSSVPESLGKIRYYNSALWDNKQDIPLHLTKKEGVASAYLPNDSFLKHFDETNTYGYALQNREVSMSADRLDHVLSETDRGIIDYMKVDVEGAAYQVLIGSEQTLRESVVVGMQIEAEFNEKYKGQRLFSSVDVFLRDFGYELFDIETCRWKRKAGLKTGGASGQPVHGELTYFLNLEVFFEKLESYNRDQKASKIIKYIVFLCLHGIYDLAYELLFEVQNREILGPELAESLRRELTKSRGILFRMPKLKGKGLMGNLVYHGLMLLFGVWFERSGYWIPEVEL